MGGVASLLRKKDARLLIAGLDSAGKTTILHKLKKGQLKLNRQVNTIPTLNFNVENWRYKNVHFSVWDVGGQDSIRPLWRHYYTGTQGLIYVVDSNDRDRVRKAAEELHKMILDNEMRFASLLVLANKIDLEPHVSELDGAAILARRAAERKKGKKETCGVHRKEKTRCVHRMDV